MRIFLKNSLGSYTTPNGLSWFCAIYHMVGNKGAANVQNFRWDIYFREHTHCLSTHFFINNPKIEIWVNFFAQDFIAQEESFHSQKHFKHIIDRYGRLNFETNQKKAKHLLRLNQKMRLFIKKMCIWLGEEKIQF